MNPFILPYKIEIAFPKSEYLWPIGTLFPSETELKIEDNLALPRGTLSILRKAFDEKLNRRRVWDLSLIEHKEPYLAAARIYMRGVACKPNEDVISLSGFSQFFIQRKFDENFHKLLNECLVICDENIYLNWKGILHDKIHILLKNVSELNKSLSTIAYVLKEYKRISTNITAQKKWLIIGGGITTDLCAFAAYLSGVKFILVPTSLLSMVDASLGGKSGVNFPPYGKNLIGAFAFPEQVLIFTDWLKTLPESEFYSGVSECIKHAILSGDQNLFVQLCESLNQKEKKEDTVSTFLETLLKIKASIVERDPHENGERSILNLGHTTAHALEALSQEGSPPTITHGEAVAVGIVFESLLAVQLRIRSWEDHYFLLQNIERSHCLLSLSELEKRFNLTLNSEIFIEKMIHYMSHDKKSSSQKIPFVLLCSGLQVYKADESSWTVDIAVSAIKVGWTEFLKNLRN